MLNDKDIDRVAARVIAGMKADQFNGLVAETADKVRTRAHKKHAERVFTLPPNEVTLDDVRRAMVDAAGKKVGVANICDTLERICGAGIRKASLIKDPATYRPVVDALADLVAKKVQADREEREALEGTLETDQDRVNAEREKVAENQRTAQAFLADANKLFPGKVKHHPDLPPLDPNPYGLHFDFGCCRLLKVAGRQHYVVMHKPDNKQLGYIDTAVAEKFRRILSAYEEMGLTHKRRAIKLAQRRLQTDEWQTLAENRGKHLAAAETAIRDATAELTASKATMKQLYERLAVYEADESETVQESNARLAHEVNKLQQRLKEADERERNLCDVLGRRGAELDKAQTRVAVLSEVVRRETGLNPDNLETANDV